MRHEKFQKWTIGFDIYVENLVIGKDKIPLKGMLTHTLHLLNCFYYKGYQNDSLLKFILDWLLIKIWQIELNQNAQKKSKSKIHDLFLIQIIKKSSILKIMKKFFSKNYICHQSSNIKYLSFFVSHYRLFYSVL